MTISLSDFGKDFQKSLDLGHVDRRLFTGFQWKGGLPRFLGGFLGLVFDRDTGVLLDNPNIDAILAIRQLTLSFAKISIPCTQYRERKAMREFVECEQDVRRADAERSPIDLEDFARVSAVLFRRMFTEVDRMVYDGNIVPKHGPGATSDRLMGNQKYYQKSWPRRLEEVFPMGEFLLPNWSYYDQLDEVDILEPGSEIPTRVVSVPKTQKTPRIISMEPTAMQYAQQGLKEVIVESIESDSVLRRIIGFEDQTPNQRMAQEGSREGTLATLDLSEASDRVSNQLVRAMTRNHAHLHKGIDACRSRKADVPGYGVMRLAKFAPMGSALCFPLEAMCFTTCIFLGIERELNTRLNWNLVKRYSNSVRVYGDDIIVPVDFVRSVTAVLESFGFKVNRSKSFWNGKFRESCGKEYYDGHDVSIVKVRKVFPTSPRNATEVIGIVELRNQLYWAGYWATCKWLDNYIRKVIKHYPVVLPTSSVLGRQSALGFETQKLHRDTHAPLVRGYVVSVRIPHNPVDDSYALLKFFLKRGGLPSVDREHLERSGRPHAVDIKLRYAPAI